MSIPYTDSIFLGLIRLFLWLLFFYVVKRLFFRGKKSVNQVNTMTYMWTFFFSLILIGIYLLTQINSYDLMTCLTIMLLFFGFRLVGLKNILVDTEKFKRKRKVILLNVIENVEDKEPIVDMVEEKPSKRLNVNFEFVVAALVGLIALFVRSYLMKYDTYQLSPAWFEDLSIIKGLSDQQWFHDNMRIVGQYAMISFYGKLTGISPEIALESYGVLQGYVLTFVIFWFMNVMTSSKITVPLISALSFAAFFNLAPLDMSQITHGKQTLTALALALPAIVYIRKPWILYKRINKGYRFGMIVIFAAIAFTDLFTLFIVIPPAFAIAAVFIRKKYLPYYWKSLGAYFISSLVVLAIYAFSCYRNQVDFLMFLSSNLLSASTVTTTVNMALNYATLLKVVQVVSAVALLVMFILYRKNKKKWASPIAFLLHINVLILYSFIDYRYFDKDLFNEILPVFISLAFGVFTYLIIYFFITGVRRIALPEKVAVPLVFIVFLALAFYTQRTLLFREEPRSRLPKDVIAAYQEIKSNFLSYSYAVVNTNSLLPISAHSHNFISYDNFLNSYTERDSVYFANKENEDFLEANTQYILPNSLLVFVYENTSENEFDLLVSDMDLSASVLAQIKKLENKGRETRVFYRKKDLIVYEIINNPKAARIDEML